MVAAVLVRNHPNFRSGKIGPLFIPLRIAGIVLIILAVIMWLLAVAVSKVDDKILNNQLVTSGIYAWVRNPIYHFDKSTTPDQLDQTWVNCLNLFDAGYIG